MIKLICVCIMLVCTIIILISTIHTNITIDKTIKKLKENDNKGAEQ